jgi:SAM-dependent methyltransferase
MDAAHRADGEQAALWGGIAGRAWVDVQPVLDHMFKPLEDLLVEAVAAGGAGRVLDVGCGTGSTTLAMARMLDTQGHCVGVDISEPMIAAASARAEREGTPARFICADAQTYPFEPSSFDGIMSRFGVMFFDDFVQAFANLRRAATGDAEMQFIAWRSSADNEFMTVAERAAAPLLPGIPVRKPDGPGQFAFADPLRVQRILQGGGWAEIDIRSIDATCSFPEKELVRYFTRMGLLGRVLHEVDEQTRARIIDTVREAFDPFVHGADVRFDAACWLVGARPGS